MNDGRKTRATESANSIQLNNHDTVAVVGGGPAGSFFATHLLRKSKELKRKLKVVVIERKEQFKPDTNPWSHRGCNSCAGGISPRLNEILREEGTALPHELVQSEIDHVWLQSVWKNFPFRVPDPMRMCTVFRGSLPYKDHAETGGLDAFLLEQAVKEGARIVCGDVVSISHTASGMAELRLETGSGNPTAIVASFVAIAAGVNAPRTTDSTQSPLLRSIRRINPRFEPAQTRKTLLVELEVGHEYLRKHMHREMRFIEHGLKELQLEHIAFVPKGQYLTVTLIGKRIDEASHSGESAEIIRDMLKLPEVAAVLPGIQDVRVGCACFPRMAVATATNSIADRLAFVGDAVGSRLYKDGLYSAYITAESLARTVLTAGVDKASLRRGFGPTVRWLTSDNRYGRLVFALSRFAFGTPVLSRIIYQSFATELKIMDRDRRALGRELWSIASGMADYREILKGMLRYSTLRSILLGSLVTFRNWLTEVFFGLNWEAHGRYPTVIVKEKRGAVVESIEASLGVEFDRRPGFERMYVIKIKGTPEEVFDELGMFGDPLREYLKLRFVDVKRVSGAPNEVGSIIRYKTRFIGVELKLSLVRAVPNKTLLYEANDRLFNGGKLVFDIKPTKDGNSRLVIYAAFDFKRGRALPGRLFWGLSRLLFPAYSHDVVWNHALCRIKGNVEGSGCDSQQ